MVPLSTSMHDQWSAWKHGINVRIPKPEHRCSLLSCSGNISVFARRLPVLVDLPLFSICSQASSVSINSLRNLCLRFLPWYGCLPLGSSSGQLSFARTSRTLATQRLARSYSRITASEELGGGAGGVGECRLM